MPQMAPISWLILMVIFSISFIIFNIMNFFNSSPLNKMTMMNLSMNNNNSNSLIWKW